MTEYKPASDDVSPFSTLTVKHGNMAPKAPLLLRGAGLMETPNGDIIAHGWLDLDAVRELRVDDYQREILSIRNGVVSSRRNSIRRALENGEQLFDIVVGMRGSNYENHGKNGMDMLLLDKVYIIDGLQRVSSLLFYAETHPEEAKKIRIGAEVRFGTNKEVEKELFVMLNTSRTPVSPNVILRNMKDKHPTLLTLYGLASSEPKFALYQRICWKQNMARTDVMTALILTKATLALHTGTKTDSASRIGPVLARVEKEYGLGRFRRNVIEFFDVVDQCFGIRTVEYRSAQPQLKGNFLAALARVFFEHENFWSPDDPKLLKVNADMRRRLSTFAISDPEIGRLAGAGSLALPILYKYITDHLNKGRRLHRLRRK